MRRITVSLALALAAAVAPASGPAAAAGMTAIGIKAGLSASTLHGNLPTDPLLQNGTRYGFGGGLSLTIGLNDVISIQPEALFVMKGTSLGTIEITGPGGTLIGTADVVEAVDYVEVPIFARISLPSPGAVSPYLLVGPTIGVRVTQKLRLSGDASGSTGIDFFRSTDVGVALGAGLELGGGYVRPLVELRYALGLTPAAEDLYSDDARNGNLLLMAGISLRR